MPDESRKQIRAAKQLIETDMLLGATDLPVGSASPGADGPAGSSVPAGAEDKQAALEAIDVGEVRGCTKCQLCQSRTNTVFGEGNPDADLFFIGEGPGSEEDRTGRPFVGRAGELLTKMIEAMGLSRGDVYIGNLVKCRPPGNRAPQPGEIRSCWGYLTRQLQIIAPKVIVTLGNPATQNMLDTRVGITKLRGQWQKLPLIGEGLAGVDVMPTYHPAFLLRQYTQENRRRVWDDLQKVMHALGLGSPDR